MGLPYGEGAALDPSGSTVCEFEASKRGSTCRPCAGSPSALQRYLSLPSRIMLTAPMLLNSVKYRALNQHVIT